MKVMPNVGDLIKHSKEGFAIITERRFIEEGAEDEFLLVWIDPKTKWAGNSLRVYEHHFRYDTWEKLT